MDPAVDDGELAGRLTVHVCIHSMEHGGLTLDARGGEAGNLPDLGGASGIRVSNREGRPEYEKTERGVQIWTMGATHCSLGYGQAIEMGGA